MKLAAMIGKLRSDSGLTQEKFAELVGVTRQAVQKWESGAAFPEIDKLVKISKHFNISLDALVFDADTRTSEELTFDKKLSPQYSTMHRWEDYSAQLVTELTQSLEEGKDIETYAPIFRSVSKLPAGEAKTKLADVLFEVILNAPTVEGYPYCEPSELETIKLMRCSEQPSYDGIVEGLSDEELFDKIHGAIIGRVCGCLLGKPVEGMRTKDLLPLLKLTENYPMHRYIMEADLTEEVTEKLGFRLNGRCYPDNIVCAPVDDDTNYTILAAKLIEKYGKDFTPWDVSRIWLDLQPKNAYCTAERVAFRNFVAGYNPPESAAYKNPYREWIGAQIRGDYFGYINPGKPELAADMAWRDASISHVKNGIYGEMFASAMIAAAAAEKDIKKIILAGLSQIPERSRLYESVNEIISLCDEKKSVDEVFAYIHEKWDEYTEHGWCHTISNAMIVAASLLLGEGDYGRSICMAVQTGFDTDCNGATVGSVLGMRNGFASIPSVWYDCLNDTLDTSIFGVGKVNLTDFAKKTFETAKG